MITELIRDGHSIKILLMPEDEDNLIPSERYRMFQREFNVHLPDHVGDIHPDIIALCTLLVVNPFVGKRLTPPLPVSAQFHLAANSVLSRYKLSDSINPSLTPRKPPSDSMPLLAYSGGVDSTAALSVMPKNTVPVFLDRPMKGKSLYNSQAAKASLERLKEIGYTTQSIPCDLEYVRHPVGFPTDMSVAVPALLIADSMDASSISFGTVMEAAYKIGHEKFHEYPSGSHYTFYSTLFNSVGIHLSMPVAGVSEVGTSMIVEKSPIGFVAQSCIRGTTNAPCLKCWKCFRKTTLNRALKLDKSSSPSLESLLSKEVKMKLTAYPIGHENVVSFTMRRYPRKKMSEGDIKILDAILERVDQSMDMGFLKRWYAPSQMLVHESWRDEFRQRMHEYLDRMNPADSSVIESWSMGEFLTDPSVISAHDCLEDVLSTIIPE